MLIIPSAPLPGADKANNIERGIFFHIPYQKSHEKARGARENFPLPQMSDLPPMECKVMGERDISMSEN